MIYQHTPVMLGEVIKLLDPHSGDNYIDCTLGGGGYTFAIAERIAPGGKIISIDLDRTAIDNAAKIISKNKYKNIILVHDNFKDLSSIVKKHFPAGEKNKFSGIVFDLGLSSAQLANRAGGFSFQLAEAPLNMSFSGQADSDAAAIINNYSQNDLIKIFRQYGEEQFAYQIARKIVDRRRENPIKTVGQLVEAIARAVPARFRVKKIHPATKVFQALRIAVNDELENLKSALVAAVDLLAPGGKLAAVSFHSLEDRIVKQFLKQESRDCLCPPSYPACRCQHQARLKIITPKVIKPTEEEVLNNPRSRSAKLRAAQKTN